MNDDDYEYVKPTLHNILMRMKYDAYYNCSHEVYVRYLIEYFHSCLALHYFEGMAKVPDGLKVSK